MALLPQKLKKGKPSGLHSKMINPHKPVLFDTGTIEASVNPITEITIDHLKQLLGSKSYPTVLDLSPDMFQIRDDGFLLNCTDIIKEYLLFQSLLFLLIYIVFTPLSLSLCIHLIILF